MPRSILELVQISQPSWLNTERVGWVLICIILTLSAKLTVASETDSFIRPWETRPYQVQVWLCGTQASEVASVAPQIAESVAIRAALIDASGWRVKVDTAPTNMNYLLSESIDEPTGIDLSRSDALSETDKLIAVVVSYSRGIFDYRVREFDVQTGQWGAVITRNCPQSRDLPDRIFDSIAKVFMPLARVERVSTDGVVTIRARAIAACQQADIIDGTVTAIENSPVWIRPDDKFLPIIRRVDRNGDLTELEPLEFTYLTVDQFDGTRVKCQIHSRQRAVLSGRSSKRAQKLALVIRPPESPTILKLVSRDDKSRPLSGYEVYSRLPGADKDEPSEDLGMTDWRGMVEIPPFDEGLRLVYVKRGNRPLLKLPIIPGLKKQLVTPVPDDEARLNAAGIISGFEIEILNLVAQRQLFRAQIDATIKKGQIEIARDLVKEVEKLETPQELKTRMADEETRLKNETENEVELGRITSMFQRLKKLVNSSMAGNLEVDLQEMIQKASSVVGS